MPSLPQTGYLLYPRAVDLINEGQICPPEDVWQYQETFGAVTIWGQGELPAPGGWRSGVLLNVLQCTGQSPQQSSQGQNISSTEVGKPSQRLKVLKLEHVSETPGELADG